MPSVAGSWCTASQLSGEGTDATSVDITVKPNDTYDERNATLTLTSGNLKRTIRVVQKQKDALLLSSAKVEIPIKGGSFTIDVKANVGFDYEIPEQFASWIHKAESRALQTTSVSFTVEPNGDASKREGYIVFRSTLGEERVAVYQHGGELLLLSANEEHIGAAGGEFSVELTSNCEYRMTSPSAGWLRVDESRAMSTHTIHFLVEPYEGVESSRTASVDFISASGQAKETLTVVQHEKSVLIIGADRVETGPGGGAVRVQFATNDEVTAEIPTYAQSWIRRSESRAVREDEMWFVVSENSSEKPREATIRFTTSTAPVATGSVTIVQSGVEFEFTEKPLITDFQDAKSHIIRVAWKSNVNISVEASGNLTAEGTDGSVHVFRLAANLAAGERPVSKLQFNSGGSTVSQLVFAQAAPQTTINRESITAGPEACSIDLPISSNTEPLCEVVGADWVTVVYGEGEIPVMEILANESTESRSADIYVRHQRRDKPQIITLIQQGVRPPAESEVTTETPGNLLRSLGSSALTVKSLEVKGKINATDLASLTLLASQGELRSIDLSDVDITADGSTYRIPEYPNAFTIEEDNTLGTMMFYKTKLQFITLPRNLRKIGRQAFEFSELQEVDVPEGVTELGENAFRGSGQLTRVSVPGTVEVLPAGVFDLCMNLSEVTLGNGIKRIGNLAFGNIYATPSSPLPALSSLKLPPTIEVIDSFAFHGSGLTSIELPRSLKTMGKSAFYMNFNLQKVNMLAAPSDGRLPDEAFYYCHSMTELTLPEGLTTLGRASLANANITDLVLPSTVREIEAYALNMVMCRRLTLPEGLTTLGEGALAQMPWLEVLELPSTLTNIGPLAFNSTYYSLREIRCHMTVPPALTAEVFGSGINRQMPLYVPAGSKEAYAADAEWGKFVNIIEF